MNQETIQWGLACIFWGLAIAVSVFNIRRQSLNQKYRNEGIQKQISGIVALTTIFTSIGVAISPWSWNGFWYLILLLEIPGFANFIQSNEGEEH